MDNPAPEKLATASMPLVLSLGLIMMFWVDINFDSFSLFFYLDWYLPLLAAWLGFRYGVRVLLAWWPLTLIPDVHFSLLDGVKMGFGTSMSTLLLSLVVAIACDRRSAPLTLEPWIRPGWWRTVQLAFCLLVLASLGGGSITIGTFQIGLLTLPAALIFLCAIRWRVLIQGLKLPIIQQRPQLEWGVAILTAAVVAASWVVRFSLRSDFWGLSFGSTWTGVLIPVLCFAIVALYHVRLRSIAAMLVAGLLANRVLAYGMGSFGDLLMLEEDWRMLHWNVFFDGFAAAVLAEIFMPFLETGAFEPQSAYRRATKIFGLLVFMMFGNVLATLTYPPAYGATLWILAASAFIAGVDWRERGLLFAPLFIEVLYLLAASVSPMGVAGPSMGYAMQLIGQVTFPFAFCGVLYSTSKRLPSGGIPMSAHFLSAPSSQVSVTDISPLARVIGKVDRSVTWRSFSVAAAPFVVLWGLIGIYSSYRQMQKFSTFFSFEWWVYALAALLAFAPLIFAFWDWLNRQDSLRLLAAGSGSIVGAIGMMVPGLLLAMSVGDIERHIAIFAVTACMLMLFGSGLLARTGPARIVFRVMLCIWAALIVWFLIYMGMMMDEDLETLLSVFAALCAAILIAIFLARFVKLRLILASDLPRELLFGELREKGFWVRMAAAAGLPSSYWSVAALGKPSFWALLGARPIVYLGMVLARTWVLVGVAVAALGHFTFYFGKRLAAREIWRPTSVQITEQPILFLRGFDDDQCDFRRPHWNLFARWMDLWAFRRNVDEAMIDEIAQFGPVVALGRPGDERTPFGALRHYSSDEDWQNTLTEAARSARAIVLVASDSPGVQWEYDLLKREQMLGKVLLLFRPDSSARESNRRAYEWFSAGAVDLADNMGETEQVPVAMNQTDDAPLLMTTGRLDAAAYVLALRLHFHEATSSTRRIK